MMEAAATKAFFNGSLYRPNLEVDVIDIWGSWLRSIVVAMFIDMLLLD